MAGHGTSSAPRAYAFTAEPAPNAAYYRLAQRDVDGAVAYSPVVFVPAAGAAGTLQLVPNPARGRVQLPGLGAVAALQLLDAQGRAVRTGTGASLSLSGLAPGLYLLRAGAPGQPLARPASWSNSPVHRPGKRSGAPLWPGRRKGRARIVGLG
ncbi:hypothetical protein ACFQT0_30875 [Hymenobacter humi]|uniref:T9SS type A sorting domain-containing protein n=1 Tax=Hymenobacter humi TaxID=1411620 RepID=A0ABW2UGU3_9BACT